MTSTKCRRYCTTNLPWAPARHQAVVSPDECGSLGLPRNVRVPNSVPAAATSYRLAADINDSSTLNSLPQESYTLLPMLRSPPCRTECPADPDPPNPRRRRRRHVTDDWIEQVRPYTP